jgi:prevent-host-death family protein
MQKPAEVKSIGDFAKDPLRVVAKVMEQGQPVVITREGKPAAVIVPFALLKRELRDVQAALQKAASPDIMIGDVVVEPLESIADGADAHLASVSTENDARQDWIDLENWPRPEALPFRPEALRNAEEELRRRKHAFGEAMRKRVAEANLSVKTLAEKLGVTPSAVSQFLSGRHKPQLRTLHRLAGVLGCRVDDLWPDE